MIRLATSLTPGFLDRGREYYNNLHERCNVPVTFFAVDFPKDQPLPECLTWASVVGVDYSTAQVKMPKWMLQHGGFCQYAPWNWLQNDVVIFTDGDAKFQRNFSEKELAMFRDLKDGDVLAGLNFPQPQTLENESARLFPKRDANIIADTFPDFERMYCYNTGFVAAKLSTWNCLFQSCCIIAPFGFECFDNAALVQFIMCYALHSDPWFNIMELPLSVHSHGHVGIFPGVTKDEEGWKHNGHLIAFAHAL